MGILEIDCLKWLAICYNSCMVLENLKYLGSSTFVSQVVSISNILDSSAFDQWISENLTRFSSAWVKCNRKSISENLTRFSSGWGQVEPEVGSVRLPL